MSIIGLKVLVTEKKRLKKVEKIEREEEMRNSMEGRE